MLWRSLGEKQARAIHSRERWWGNLESTDHGGERQFLERPLWLVKLVSPRFDLTGQLLCIFQQTGELTCRIRAGVVSEVLLMSSGTVVELVTPALVE